MAYRTLLIAESVDHGLTIVLGVVSRHYKTEDAYLQGVLLLLDYAKRSPDDFLEQWLLEDSLSPEALKKAAVRLEQHVQKTLATPLNRRGSSG